MKTQIHDYSSNVVFILESILQGGLIKISVVYSQVSLGYATVRVRKSRISVAEFVSFIHENEPTQQFFPRVKVAELAENDDQGNSNCCG